MRGRNMGWVTAAALVLALLAPAAAATATPRDDGKELGQAFLAGGSVWQAVEATLERMGLFSTTNDPTGEEPEPEPPVPMGDDGGDSVALDPSATSNLGPTMDPDGQVHSAGRKPADHEP